MNILRQTLQILRVEVQFFVHFPQLLWAMAFVALLPALLAGQMALLMACFVGRWRYARPGSVRPAVDF